MAGLSPPWAESRLGDGEGAVSSLSSVSELKTRGLQELGCIHLGPLGGPHPNPQFL